MSDAYNCEWPAAPNVTCYYTTTAKYCTADEAFERVCGRPQSCAMPTMESYLMPWYPLALVVVLVWAIFFNRMPTSRS